MEYIIDWVKWIAMVLAIRGPNMQAFIYPYLAPLILRHASFLTFRDDTLYKLQHTGQVIYLEKVLNEAYQVTGYDSYDHENTKEIYITDGVSLPNSYLFQDFEEKPIFLGENFIYTKSEMDEYYVDFFINIPATISFNEDTLRALVNFYKLPAKKYQILIY